MSKIGQVRNFVRGDSEYDSGDWQIPTVAIQSPTYNVISQTAWNISNPIITPGKCLTFQLLALPPVVTGASPFLGEFLVEVVECRLFDVFGYNGVASAAGNQFCIGIISPFTLGSTTTIPGGQTISLDANLTTTDSETVAETIAGTPTTVAWTGSITGTNSFSGGITGSIDGSLGDNVTTTTTTLTGLHLCGDQYGSGGNAASMGVGLNLYVSRYNLQSNQWTIQDINNPLTGIRGDLLDYEVDVYQPPQLAGGYTARSWAVSLPYPIIIGSGMALHATLSNAAGSVSGLWTVPFIRSRFIQVA